MSSLPEADAAEVARVWSGAVFAEGEDLPDIQLTVSARSDLSLTQLLSLLSQKVTLAAIEGRRGDLWMLHAAGLADEDGRVVVLVGPSGQGKTTASRTLAAHYGYVSDETVSIDADGTVLPYRKPLSVIVQDHEVKVQRPPNEIGLKSLPDAPLTLAAVVLLDRRPDGPDEAVLEACDLGEALSELIAQTSYIGELPNPLRTIAKHAAATGGVRRVIYREASSLQTALAPLFQNSVPAQPAGPVIEPQPTPEAAGIVRGDYLDALQLEDPDRIALLQTEPDGGTMFRMVDGIGPALWRAADGATVAELAAAAADTYGRPEGIDIEAVVAAAITELSRERVLATSEPPQP